MAKNRKPQEGAADFATPPVPAPSPPRDWREHDHVTTPIKAQAQRLIGEAESVELAKHAVDSAAESGPVSTDDKDEFARRNGFTSYLDLFEASTRTKARDKNWFVTPLRGGGWIVWNDVDLRASSVFPSAEDARRFAGEQNRAMTPGK